MSRLRSLIAPVVVVCVVAIPIVPFALGVSADAPVEGASSAGARYALTGGGSPALPAPAPLRFAPEIAVSDQKVVLQAVSQARPEAQRVIELVTGMVTVRVGALGNGVAGQTRPTDGGYDVVLDLGGVFRGAGMRGVRRLVLHELAHVVDHALVGADLEAQLDAATPPGFGCDDGISGGCAAREERFAESFAKWATGDVGHDLYIGYRVPPPTSLSGWGAPLAALAR